MNLDDMRDFYFYKVTKDIENPCADRRKRNTWNAEPVIKAGLVLEFRCGYFEKGFDACMPRSPLFPLLVEAVEAVPDSAFTILSRYNQKREACDLIDNLVKAGKISYEDVEKEAARMQKQDEIEDAIKLNAQENNRRALPYVNVDGPDINNP